MKQALIILAVHMTLLIALNVIAAPMSIDQLSNNEVNPSTELSCKAKAKDIAMKTYNNCMTEARNREIEDIRSNYKKELHALKSKYEGRLQALNPEKANTTKAAKANKVIIQQKVRNENSPDYSTPETLPLSKNGSEVNIQTEGSATDIQPQMDSFESQ